MIFCYTVLYANMMISVPIWSWSYIHRRGTSHLCQPPARETRIHGTQS